METKHYGQPDFVGPPQQSEFEKAITPLNDFEQAKFDAEKSGLDGFSPDRSNIDHDGVDRDGDGYDFDVMD